MNIALRHYYFFDRDSENKREHRVVQDRQEISVPGRPILCARCRHPITTREQRLPVNGSVEHDFTNPLGIAFHIACFRDAPGCGAVGEATAEHTWFPGHAWQIGVCRKCGTHLGWLFRSSTTAFYGLIVGQLVEGVA